jgi:hypothetical protein
MRGKDFLLGDYSPATGSEKAGWQNPELVSQFLEGLIPGRGVAERRNRTAKENRSN